MSSAEWVLDEAPPKANRVIRYGRHPSQFAELRRAASQRAAPVVLCIHGGFWKSEYDLNHLGHFCAALSRQGVCTLSLEYRRLGETGGGFPRTLEDIALAARELPRLTTDENLDWNQVTVTGHSAGGHLALWLAGERLLPGLRRVVALAPVTDLVEAHRLRLSQGVVERFMGGSPQVLPDAYRQTSPLTRLPLGVEQVLVHGTADDVVPFALSRAYVERASALNEKATLVALDGAGHFEPIDPRGPNWSLETRWLLPATL